MELIGGLALKLIGGAAAGGAAAGAASGGISGLSILQGIAGAVGVVAQIGAASAQASELKAQAKEQEFQARQEYIEGKETSAALKLELARTVANQQVAFAAGGVDLGSVSAATAKSQAIKDAESELSINSSESLSRSLARKRAAANLRSKASGVMTAGVIGGIQSGLGTLVDIKERGA